MRNYLALFIGLTASLFAADCDIVFTLDKAGDTVQFNNKGKACANFQVSYFASGFSALSLQFESAPDAGTTPGTWAAFAGTTLSGANPMTAITQQTSTFSGVYPWIRIRLVSKTGTGQITGRMLGIQLTSAALGFSNAFSTQLFGNFTTPISANFTSVDLGAGTRINTASSIILIAPVGAGGVRAKACFPVAAPFTLVMAWRLLPTAENPVGNQNGTGMGLLQTGTGEEEFFRSTPFNNGLSASPMQHAITYTTNNAWAGAASRNGGNGALNNCAIYWGRIVDDGVTREYRLSCDGTNWIDFSPTNWNVSGASYAAITPDRACFHAVTSSATYTFGGELLSCTLDGNPC